MRGEYERGMTKRPIAIEATEATEAAELILPTSRLRMGRTFTIECNVKVRDIGKVVPEHKIMLLRYHRDVRDAGFDPDDTDEDQPVSAPHLSEYPAAPGYYGAPG
jgi:hypothetical protein